MKNETQHNKLMGDAEKPVLRENFTAIDSYIKKKKGRP